MGTRVISPGAVGQAVLRKLDQRTSTQDFGMVPDCIQGVRGSMTAGSPTLTIAAPESLLGAPDPSLTYDYLNKPIAVRGAGVPCYTDNAMTQCAGNVLMASILVIASDKQSAMLDANAVNDVSGAQWACGTDNSPMFNEAWEYHRAMAGDGGKAGVWYWDKPGSYFFASSNFTNFNGWYFLAGLDFSGFRIVQGEHTKIVIGCPMHLLSVNEEVFNKWTGADPDNPPTASVVGSIEKGATNFYCDPGQIAAGDFKKGDWIEIYTGYVISTFWAGFEIPDAQIVQILFANPSTGEVILAEPTLKPFAQEDYPSPGGWTGPTGPAPFGIRKVTDILIHDFTWEGLNIDSFFYTLQIYGGQCHNFNLKGVKGRIAGSFHAMNYIHTGLTENVNVSIDNTASTAFPNDYAWTAAVGSSHLTLRNARINGSSVIYLHIHEGAANVTIDNLRLGTRHLCPQSFAHSCTGGAILAGSTTLEITGGTFSADDVGKTLVAGGFAGLNGFTAAVTAFIDSTHVSVNPPPQVDISGATVTVGSFIQAVHIADRSYGFKATNSSFSGYDQMAAIYVSPNCTDGGLFLNCEIIGREAAMLWPDTPGSGGYPWDAEIFGKGWRFDCPKIPASRIYQQSENIGLPLLNMGAGQTRSLEATTGMGTPLGGFGLRGNILKYSEDYTVAPWASAAGATITPNTTDVSDPVGGFGATKVETGPTTADMVVSFDVDTPDDETTVFSTSPTANGNRTFIFSFYGYSPIENQMRIAVASFIPATPAREAGQIFYLPVHLSPLWRRYDFQVTFSGAAGTQINGGFLEPVAPTAGLSSTFYFWGATLQEVPNPNSPFPLITQSTGDAVPYDVSSPGDGVIQYA